MEQARARAKAGPVTAGVARLLRACRPSSRRSTSPFLLADSRDILVCGAARGELERKRDVVVEREKTGDTRCEEDRRRAALKGGRSDIIFVEGRTITPMLRKKHTRRASWQRKA